MPAFERAEGIDELLRQELQVKKRIAAVQRNLHVQRLQAATEHVKQTKIQAKKKVKADLELAKGLDIINFLHTVSPAQAGVVNTISEEINMQMVKLFPSPGDRQWFRLFKHVDTDGSGKLSYLEWASLLREQMGIMPDEISDEMIAAVFCALDEDSDGEISHGEFGRFMRRGAWVLDEFKETFSTLGASTMKARLDSQQARLQADQSFRMSHSTAYSDMKQRVHTMQYEAKRLSRVLSEPQLLHGKLTPVALRTSLRRMNRTSESAESVDIEDAPPPSAPRTRRPAGQSPQKQLAPIQRAGNRSALKHPSKQVHNSACVGGFTVPPFNSMPAHSSLNSPPQGNFFMTGGHSEAAEDPQQTPQMLKAMSDSQQSTSPPAQFMPPHPIPSQPPPPLPHGWSIQWSPQYYQHYFVGPTGAAQWERPAMRDRRVSQ